MPKHIITRLRHYFLTYKDIPGEEGNTVIEAIYDREEALEVIRISMQDYSNRFDNLGKMLVLDD